MTVTASAPASSANLGPGFDVLALALGLRSGVTATPASDWAGPDFCVRVARQATDSDPVALAVESGIPIGKGLGSSAAVAAATVAATQAAHGEAVDRDDVYRRVAALEGHADNAAAAVYGGFVAVLPGGARRSLVVHPSLQLVVGVPDQKLPTSEARAALPDQVSLGAAVRTIARVEGLIQGLVEGDATLLRAVGADELHEPYRAALRPVISSMLEAARRAGAFHACLSGAGPSVLAVADASTAAAVAAALAEVVGTDGEVLTPDVDRGGLTVVAG